MGIAFGIIVLLIVIGYFVWSYRKRKAEAWAGVVENMQVHRTTDSEGDESVSFYLHVKLDDGSSKKVSVGERVYNQFAKGDKIVKNPGSYNPVKG